MIIDTNTAPQLSASFGDKIVGNSDANPAATSTAILRSVSAQTCCERQERMSVSLVIQACTQELPINVPSKLLSKHNDKWYTKEK